MLITLTPLGGSEYTLIAEDNSTPFVLQAQDWGNAAWEHQYAGTRGTQGARPAQGTLPNRTVRLQLRLYGSSTDDMAARQAEVEAVMDALRRRGGWITRRAHGQTYRQHMEVLTTPGLNAGEWSTVTDTRYILSPILEFVCAPYAHGDPMAYTDLPAAIVADYTRAVGTSDPVVNGAGLASVTAIGTHVYLDARGYEYGDVQAAAHMYPGATAAGDRRWGMLLRYVDADNYLAVTVEQVSGTGYVRIRSRIGGAETVLGTATLAASLTTAAATGGWLIGALHGERVQVQWLPGDLPPTTPWATSEGTSITLTGTALATWGPGTEGRVGLYCQPQDTSGTGGWSRARIQPCFIRDWNANPVHKQALPLRVTIPGTAPALAAVSVTADDSAAIATHFALIGWAAREGGWNRCGMGDFAEGAPLGGRTTGWVVSAVTGITAAATSLTAATDGGQATLVLTTTTSSGAAYALADEFVAGRTYRATCEVKLSAGSPVVRLALGKNGDLATSGAITATADWQTVTVDWTPTADVYGGADWPTVAVRSNATAGGTVLIRRVSVYALADPPVRTSQLQGRHGRPPLGVVPYGGGGWQVDASSGGTLTIVTSGSTVMLPAAANMSALTGAGSLVCSCLVDPSLASPDDYTAGTIDVDVWVRARVPTTAVAVRLAAWAMYPWPSSTTTDDYGRRRAAAPWGTTGRPVPGVGASGNWKWMRVGPVSMAVTPDTPGPWRLVVAMTWAAGSSGGDLGLNGIVLTPARSRALTPTGVSLAAGGYPSFIPLSASVVMTKHIAPDLSGAVELPPSHGVFGDSGLGGSLIELPTGARNDLLALFTNQVPDDPAAPATTVGQGNYLTVAVSPTPRWGHLRDV